MKLVRYILLLILLVTSAWAEEVALITEKDIKVAVLKEFAEQGHDEEIELDFFGGRTNFVLPEAKSVRIMVSELEIDTDQNKFSANAEIFADGERADNTHISGKFYIMVSGFVPNLAISKGEIINENMLKNIKLKSNRLKENQLIYKDKLIGKQAKKTLKEGKIINDRDIGEAVVLRKGDIVTAIYKSRGMQITSKAEALEDGAKGQRIELENTKSGRKFVAKVIDAASVEIDNE